MRNVYTVHACMDVYYVSLRVECALIMWAMGLMEVANFSVMCQFWWCIFIRIFYYFHVLRFIFAHLMITIVYRLGISAWISYTYAMHICLKITSGTRRKMWHNVFENKWSVHNAQKWMRARRVFCFTHFILHFLNHPFIHFWDGVVPSVSSFIVWFTSFTMKYLTILNSQCAQKCMYVSVCVWLCLCVCIFFFMYTIWCSIRD